MYLNTRFFYCQLQPFRLSVTSTVKLPNICWNIYELSPTAQSNKLCLSIQKLANKYQYKLIWRQPSLYLIISFTLVGIQNHSSKGPIKTSSQNPTHRIFDSVDLGCEFALQQFPGNGIFLTWKPHFEELLLSVY